MAFDRVILLVMDSVGAGETPDAASYGDAGANTLGHTAEAVGGARLPNLEKLGLGRILPMKGVAPIDHPLGAFGKCAELSAGKDTSTGHWEIAGLRIDKPFTTFPNGFPEEILRPLRERTGKDILGNCTASGTEIIKTLGPEHMRTGALIVYTSADSVLQIAAHEQVIPPDELHKICKIAREIVDPYGVGRIIARPFVGTSPENFKRTYNRKDFAVPPPKPTVLDHISKVAPVIGIGKIADIYCNHGITKEIHTEGNHDGMLRTIEALEQTKRGLIMTNLVDFDSMYGHRRDPQGYYRCLQEFDVDLASLQAKLSKTDLVMITADHGNDPTFPGSDHTREYVPLLAFGETVKPGSDLGTRTSFADIGATLAEVFSVEPPSVGKSFTALLG